MSDAVPISARERIVAIDIIRGFALFGVLWINLYEHAGLIIPEDVVAGMATAAWDAWIGPLSSWLMESKAQALFSMLFGFGFANIMTRLEAKGLPAGRIFMRRIAVLGLFGAIDVFLLWIGDILHAYALMGFLLYFTRNWSMRTLIVVGLPVAVLGGPMLQVAIDLLWGGVQPWREAWEMGPGIRYPLFQQADYPAYVAELARSNWAEWWSQPILLSWLAQIFGRFLIGSWIYRNHWFDDPAAHRVLFAKVAKVALPLGLAIAALPMLRTAFDIGLPGAYRYFNQLGALTLAVGYGAGIVLLHLAGRFEALFKGLAAVGRMALTNYLAQSLFYLFAIYGFGLNLLPYLGPTLSLTLAILFFAVQIGFSLWWLERYRFGPMEWLWRSLTYGERQPMRALPATA